MKNRIYERIKRRKKNRWHPTSLKKGWAGHKYSKRRQNKTAN